jgi:hypothetical protein
MKLKLRLTVLVALFLLPHLGLAKVAILINSSVVSDDVALTAYAIYYLTARAQYYEEHSAELPKPGEIVPASFDDEFYAFSGAVGLTRELERQKEKVRDYWKIMCAVEQAGFLREYIVVFRKKTPSAGARATLRVKDFLKWAESNLTKVSHDEVDQYGQIKNDG